MKKAVVILAALATLALAGCESELPYNGYDLGFNTGAYTLCIEGHKFAVFSKGGKGNMIQLWENGPDGPRPMECKGVAR